MSELVCKILELLAESKGAFASAIENIFNTKTMETLKISDLSVGDWVQDNYGDNVKVAGIWQGCNFNYQVDILRDGRIGPIVPCNLRPIPITAEILEKNGWEKEGGSYRWSNEKYRVFIWLKKFSHFVDVIEMDMQFATKNSCIEVSQLYVHLLQHVLRLAGVDKEINL